MTMMIMLHWKKRFIFCYIDCSNEHNWAEVGIGLGHGLMANMPHLSYFNKKRMYGVFKLVNTKYIRPGPTLLRAFSALTQ